MVTPLARILTVVAFAGLFAGGVPVGMSLVHDTPTSTTSTTDVTTTTAPQVLTLSAVGDVMLGMHGAVPANPNALLAPLKPLLAADIVFGNLEGTLTNESFSSKCGGAPSNSCYAFAAPPSQAAAYRSAGFTVLNSANNHSNDYGTAGALETTNALHAAGIAQTGRAGQVGYLHVGPTVVAVVGFAPYSFDNNFLSLSSAAHLLAVAHSHADLVVAYFHAGAEGMDATHVTRTTETFYGENRGNPYALGHFAVNHGAALVIMSGPHVVRGMEWYHDHLIDYSMGDFVNYHNFAAVGDLTMSEILHVSLDARTGTILAASVTPMTLNSAGAASRDLSGHTIAFVNALSRHDFGSSAAIIAANGTIIH